MPRCRPLLSAALALAPAALLTSCDPPDETHALRALATVRARVALPADAVAAQVALYSRVDADGALEVVELRRVEPITTSARAGARDAYALFAVRPGEHRLVATVLTADDRTAPHCAPAEIAVTVDAPAYTEVELSPRCDGSVAAR